MNEQETKFNAYCDKQYSKHFPNRVSPDPIKCVYPHVVAQQGRPAFDHSFIAWRVCLWSPWADLRVHGDTPVEFGIVSEPYNFSGNVAQLSVAMQHGFEFRRIRKSGFHHPSTTPYLWIVRDLNKASAVFQALLGYLPAKDIYGFVPAGQTLTVVDDQQAHSAARAFFSALDAAQ